MLIVAIKLKDEIEIDINEEAKIVTISREYPTGESSKMTAEAKDESTLDDALNSVPGLFELYYSEHVGTCAHCSHQI